MSDAFNRASASVGAAVAAMTTASTEMAAAAALLRAPSTTDADFAALADKLDAASTPLTAASADLATITNPTPEKAEGDPNAEQPA